MDKINHFQSTITSVQASAGSGKTYNLAKRYLNLLLCGDETIKHRNIIAVTFTNKAAIEMKYRIITYLKQAALGVKYPNFFYEFNLSEKKISEKSAKRLDDILNDYDSFNVCTIDSFKNHILQSCAINIGIPPNFSIEQDSSKTMLFALEIFLQKASKSQELRYLIILFLKQYVLKDTASWIAKDNLYSEIKNIFEKSGNYSKEIDCSNQTDFKNEQNSIIEKIYEDIIKFGKIVDKLGANAHYRKAVKQVLEHGKTIFHSLSAIPNRFSYDKVEYLKNNTPNAIADEIWKNINANISNLANFSMENFYNIYSKIYSKIAVEFDAKSRKEGILFLNEINKKAVELFDKNPDIMPEVYYRLSEKYKHFLIDEFQDTSPTQWRGIKKFLDESLASSGSFFYVGDGKQAIYNFRGGNPEIFKSVSEQFPMARLEEIYLEQNFRSDENIVNFNNNVFSQNNINFFLNEAFKESKKTEICEKFIGNILNFYRHSEQKSSKINCGYVEITILSKDSENEKNKDESIKLKFLEIVADVLCRFPPRDLTILCRTHAEVQKISLWLLENNYDIESEQTLNIRNNNTIKQLISLIEFIDSPINDTSFASFLLGNIFLKNSGFCFEHIESFIFLNNTSKKGFLYKNFRNDYENLWNECFEELFATAGFIPIYELVLIIIEKFKIISNFPKDKAFVMQLLEVIKNFENDEKNLKTLKDFLSYINELDNNQSALFIRGISANAIKIMTVHKAKGLQFPVVIIPFLALSEKTMKNPFWHEETGKIKLLEISEKTANFSQKAAEIYYSQKVNSMLSELNILYVSMTRAENELYGILPAKSGNSNNKAITLLSKLPTTCGNKQSKKIKETQEEHILTDNSYDDYKDIRHCFNKSKISDIDIDDAKQRGIILHYALSRIKSLKNTDLQNTVKKACLFTKRKFPFENTGFVEEKLNRLFLREDILKFFMFDENEVFNEKEIVDIKGESFRIDKLILSNEVMLVDFKSSSQAKEENQQQVEKYAQMLSEIYPNKRINRHICIIDEILCRN
ncbi:MAG: UvrD-helicase domain-containing protein [Elusimicrobiota bacterium]|jgi:ATP-dependent exoDNAse (exonuclease V) beta subunit|nr:UvrD-helicase domain-containing protein [Elusimicrobiota bacterium]